MNDLVVVVVPPAFVTAIFPVVALEGTLTLIWFAVSRLKAASTPLRETAVVPTTCAPWSRTFVPTPPVVGAKLTTFGLGAGNPASILQIVPFVMLLVVATPLPKVTP